MRFSGDCRLPEPIPITGCRWLTSILNGGLRPGGCYTVTGQPAGGKSTTCYQMAAALASHGLRVLLILTEQHPTEVAAVIDRVSRKFSARAREALWKNLEYESLDCPEHLGEDILPKIDGEFGGVRVVIVDSVQGSGLAGSATNAYPRVFQFADQMKSRGLCLILVSHVNKQGRLAGPRTFEHKPDVIIQLRNAYKFRHLFLVKNRFGPELAEPLILEFRDGRLEPSKHRKDQCAVIVGYDPRANELLEIQASVTLPRLGRRGALHAPFLPRQRLEAILPTLSGLAGVDLSEMVYIINAYVPAGYCYSGELDLPLSIAMVAAYLRQSVPTDILFAGHVDLFRQVRPPQHHYREALTKAISTEVCTGIRQIVVSSAAAGLIGGELSSSSRLKMIGVATLDELIAWLWPDLFAARPVLPKRVRSARRL